MPRTALLLVLAALLLWPTAAVSAEPQPYCQPGETPHFVHGFKALAEALDGVMGEPLSCEHTDPSSGDSHQLTSTGLAYYRKATNTPTFTNGTRHWALTSELVSWTDGSIDPPGIVVPPPTDEPPLLAAAEAVVASPPAPPRWPEGWTPGPAAHGAPNLVGSIDLATASVPQYSPLRVYGWAANLDDPATPGITDVHVYLGDLSANRFLGAAVLGKRRPDVAQALGNPRLETAGFEVEIPTGGLGRGTHTLSFLVKTREQGWWQRKLEIEVSAPLPRPRGQFVYGVHLANPAASAPLARAAGFTHMWAYVPWRQVEPSPGRFLFKEQDRWGGTMPNDLTNVLKAARENGLKLVLRLDEPPDWAGGRVYRLDPADVERYVYEVVSYGAGTVAAVEVFNEVNLPLEWGTSPTDPAAYARILAGAYRGAKRADPAVTVISAAPSPRTGGLGGTMEDVDWIEGLYRAGGKNHFDALGMHPYIGNFHPQADPHTCAPMCFRIVELYRAVMEQYGDASKMAFITEMGALEHSSTPLGPYDWMKLAPQTRGDYLVTALNMAQDEYPWIMGAMVFNLDYATVPWVGAHTEKHWFSLLNPDRSPRAAYHHIQQARASGVLR